MGFKWKPLYDNFLGFRSDVVDCELLAQLPDFPSGCWEVVNWRLRWWYVCTLKVYVGNTHLSEISRTRRTHHRITEITLCFLNTRLKSTRRLRKSSPTEKSGTLDWSSTGKKSNPVRWSSPVKNSTLISRNPGKKLAQHGRDSNKTSARHDRESSTSKKWTL